MFEYGVDVGVCIVFSGCVVDVGGVGFFMVFVVIVELVVDNLLWIDEVFGFVVCVKLFCIDDEVIVFVNDMCYGFVVIVVMCDVVVV